MSQSFELNAVEVIKIKVKRKVKSKTPPPSVVAVAEEEEPLLKQSIWMSYRREPKEKPPTFVWEHIEDISDDENDTPQAAGKRLSQLKATRDQIQRRAYETKLDALQSAGLFLGWSAPKFIEPHPWQDTPFDYIVTAPYPC